MAVNQKVLSSKTSGEPNVGDFELYAPLVNIGRRRLARKANKLSNGALKAQPRFAAGLPKITLPLGFGLGRVFVSESLPSFARLVNTPRSGQPARRDRTREGPTADIALQRWIQNSEIGEGAMPRILIWGGSPA